MAADRYNYQVTKNENEKTLMIEMPKREYTVIINDTDFEDNLEYTIYVPKGMFYTIEYTKTPMPL